MRIAIFLTGNATPFTQARYGSYADLFVALLADAGEVWDIFDVQAGEYPDRLSDYHAILVTGSAADAHGNEPWIQPLFDVIRDAYGRGIKLVGVCFGHQAIALALGGRSGRNTKGWELGIHEVQFNQAFQEKPYALGIDESLKTLEVHQDHVSKAPPGADVLAETPLTPVQMFAMGDQVLCMQGHPEFFNDVVKDLIDRRSADGVIDSELAKEALASLSDMPDRDQYRSMIRRFLFGEGLRVGALP